MSKRFLYPIRSAASKLVAFKLTSKLMMSAVLLTLAALATLHLFGDPQGRTDPQGQGKRRGERGDREDRQKYPEIPGKTVKPARALAVMIWLGDAKKIANPRLIPLYIYYNNQFNDANTYMADPYPLALTNGTVYEVQTHGEREGFFKVGLIHRIKAEWVGLGQWLTEAEVAAMHKPRAKRTQSADDDRPIMRRSSNGGSGSGGSGSAGRKEQVNPEEDNPDLADAMSSDEHRPMLRRNNPPAAAGSGSGGSGSAGGSSAASSTGDDDGDRAPVFNPEDSARDLAQELSTDASRPSLKHNAGQQRPDPDKFEAHTITTHKPQASEGDVPSTVPLHLMVAVSDPGVQENHSFAFKWNPGEEEKYRKLLNSMALKELAAARHPIVMATPAGTAASRTKSKSGAKATARKPEPEPELQDVRMQAFDLAFNNTPVIVFSASVKSPDSTLVRYVTVVTRTDAVGQTDKIFSSVTASDRLDVTPRLLLVDAIDGYGSGRGDLLFQQVSDTGTTFALYRAERGNLAKIFEGGELPGIAAAQ